MTIPESQISTYHCLCSELILASTIPTTSLPKRQSDNSAICTLAPSPESLAQNGTTVLLTSSVEIDAVPIVLRLDDGFEKRYAAKCGRCGITFGYQLCASSWGDGKDGVRGNVLYLLPKGVIGTEDVESGRKMTAEEVSLEVKG